MKHIKYLLSFLILFTACFLIVGCSNNSTKWEYKVEKYFNDGYDRVGNNGGKISTIHISEADLDILGEEGWELVSSSLELETAYYNFGNTSYVTGIQPNIRPQCLICIFKRPVGSGSKK